MSNFSIIVLVAGAIATIALVLYVSIYLPRHLEQRSLESMRAFSTAIELRFPRHKGVTEEVIRLSKAIAHELGLSRKERYHLEMAAHLRDIGLCAIPYSLVNRSPLQLTPAEEATYNRHAEVSGAMLELVPSLRHLAEAVRYHHMHYDDFPKLVDGKEFSPPLIAEIISIASAFAWTEIKDGYPAARAMVEAESGREFHPRVAQALLRVITSSRVDEPLRSAVV